MESSHQRHPAGGLLLETPCHPAEPETEQGPARPIASPVFRPAHFWQQNLHLLEEPTERLEGEEEGEQPYVSGIAGGIRNQKFPEPSLNQQRLTA